MWPMHLLIFHFPGQILVATAGQYGERILPWWQEKWQNNVFDKKRENQASSNCAKTAGVYSLLVVRVLSTWIPQSPGFSWRRIQIGLYLQSNRRWIFQKWRWDHLMWQMKWFICKMIYTNNACCQIVVEYSDISVGNWMWGGADAKCGHSHAGLHSHLQCNE